MVRLIKPTNEFDHSSNTGNADAITTATVNTGTKASSDVNVRLAATCGTRTSLNRRTTTQANPNSFPLAKPCHQTENGILFSFLSIRRFRRPRPCPGPSETHLPPIVTE